MVAPPLRCDLVRQSSIGHLRMKRSVREIMHDGAHLLHI